MRGDQFLTSPVMIGRAREILQLEQALHAAQQGAGRCILIAGEAGVGKSRLLGELRQRARKAGFSILQGNCFEQDSSFPYAPWIDALRVLLARRSPDEIRALLAPLAAEFLKLLPELAPMLIDAPPAFALDSEAEKRLLFDAWVRLGERLAESQPLLLVLEDLHWSDETSLDLAHFFARRVPGAPILLIATYRDEQDSPHLARFLAQMNRERLGQMIALHPLARDEIAEMMRVILELTHSLQDGFINRIATLTEGNPFFVEEILKSLIAAGDFHDLDGQWESKAVEELYIPPSVREVVLQRTERLPGETQHLLTLAAVAGQRFDFSLIKELSQMQESDLVTRLKELVAAQLIAEESADQFAFRHALTREAVYNTLLYRERRALHQQIGEMMEELYPDQDERELHIGELAHHFYQGAVWDKALEYAQRAGERARELYALPEALTHLTRAVDAAQKLARLPSVELLCARGSVYETLGKFDNALADYTAALERARAEQGRRLEWQVLLALGFLWVERDYERAGKYFRNALALARTLGDPAALGHTLNRIGNWHMNLDEPLDAKDYHREALDIFEELNDERGLAETYELLGVSHYNSGDALQGTVYCERALELYRKLDDRQGLILAMTHLLLPAMFENEVTEPVPLGKVMATTETALNMAREMSWRAGEALSLQTRNEVLSARGEYGRALVDGQAAMVIAREIGHRFGISVSSLMLGRLYLDIFAVQQAQEKLQEGLAAARESGSIMFLRFLIPSLVSSYTLQKDWANAEALLDLVPQADIRRASRGLRLCWLVRAELELARGNPERALEIMDELLASAPNLEKFGEHSVARLCHGRGQALAALGRTQEAEAEMSYALDAAQRHEQYPLIWRIHASRCTLYLSQGNRDKAEREATAARTVIQELASKIPEGALRDNFVQRALAILPSLRAPSPRQAAKQGFGGLTEREREVAKLIVLGKSNREIAGALVLSERTVEKHVANILAKLDFSSRAQIAAWAVERRLNGQSSK